VKFAAGSPIIQITGSRSSAVTPNSPCTSGTPMPRAQLERVISVEKRMLRCTLAGGLTRFARRRSRTSRDRDPLNHERSRNSSCTSRLHSTHLARAISKNQPAPRYPRSAKRKGWNERVLDAPLGERTADAGSCSLFRRLHVVSPPKLGVIWYVLGVPPPVPAYGTGWIIFRN